MNWIWVTKWIFEQELGVVILHQTNYHGFVVGNARPKSQRLLRTFVSIYQNLIYFYEIFIC